MKIAVLANGAWEPDWGKSVLNKVDFLICADGGANHAFLSGRIPDLLIGDLDSISPANLKLCENYSGCVIQQYPCEKDETDLELALIWAERQARQTEDQEILLYGAAGKRMDHFLANIALMLAYARKGLRLRLVDLEHEMWIVQGRENIPGSKGQKLSLIVLSSSAVITTEGLYYSLQQETLFQDSPRGVSNVFLDNEAVVQVHEGWVLVVLPKIGE